MQVAEDTHRQVETIGMTLDELIVLESFVEGYGDALADRPYNQAAVDDDEGAWAYERGRLAAIYARKYCDRIPMALDTWRDMARIKTILFLMQHEGLFL